MRRILIILAAILIASLFCSCRTKYIVVPGEHTHDTITDIRWRYDSIHVLDSSQTIIREINDTVYLERDRWHIEYRDRLSHDSIYISRTDTITQTVTTNELTRWQRYRLASSDIVFLISIALILVFAVKPSMKK